MHKIDPADLGRGLLVLVGALLVRMLATFGAVAGGALSGRTPFSHLQYWTDRRFTREVADYLLTLL